MNKEIDKFKKIIANTTEIVNEDELMELLEKKPNPLAYIGFEPSGFAHIGWIIQVEKVKDLTDAGFEVIIFLADWHAYINDKLNGSMGNIEICARYMKDCFISLGIDKKKTKFVYANDLIDIDYWEKIVLILKKSSLSRIKRALTIMGRKEDEAEGDASKFIYPAMQVADIYQMKLDLALGGMDQRKAHMLARDVGEKIGWKKPIAIHTPLLSSLEGGERMDQFEAKMSKSKKDSCIFIHDSKEEIKKKIKKAYCPIKIVDSNPILDICKYIIFPKYDKIKIERPLKFGGDLEFESFNELINKYEKGEIHPLDLKNCVTKYLLEILKVVRDYFEKKPDNLEAMKRIVN